MNDTTKGVLITLVAGLVGSALFVPMKFIRQWKWENTWLAYSAQAYFLFPWIAALITVPSLFTLYTTASASDLALALLFGLLWGTGVVLYGLAVDVVGLSLSSSVILGCSVSVGSLVPLLVKSPEKLLTAAGRWMVLADCVIIAGLVCCARAGALREAGSMKADVKKGSSAPAKSRFSYGLLLCLISGATAPLLNLALTFVASIKDRAIEAGAQPEWAANSIWGPLVSAGSIPSLVYCLYLLRRRGTWGEFRLAVSPRNLFLCSLMGVLFMASTVLYGTATSFLGNLGEAVGWPVYVSALILGSNFWGFLTAEWKSASREAIAWLLIGVVSQLLGVTILNNISGITAEPAPSPAGASATS